MLNDNICLTIPSKADYISIVRLAASGLANNLNLNIEEIEDIKVCVGEACNNALNLGGSDAINIGFAVVQDRFTIYVSNVKEEVSESMEDHKEGELGLFIIKALMDEVNFSDEGIEMIKYIE